MSLGLGYSLMKRGDRLAMCKEVLVCSKLCVIRVHLLNHEFGMFNIIVILK